MDWRRFVVPVIATSFLLALLLADELSRPLRDQQRLGAEQMVDAMVAQEQRLSEDTRRMEVAIWVGKEDRVRRMSDDQAKTLLIAHCQDYRNWFDLQLGKYSDTGATNEQILARFKLYEPHIGEAERSIELARAMSPAKAKEALIQYYRREQKARTPAASSKTNRS